MEGKYEWWRGKMGDKILRMQRKVEGCRKKINVAENRWWWRGKLKDAEKTWKRLHTEKMKMEDEADDSF